MIESAGEALPTFDESAAIIWKRLYATSERIKKLDDDGNECSDDEGVHHHEEDEDQRNGKGKEKQVIGDEEMKNKTVQGEADEPQQVQTSPHILRHSGLNVPSPQGLFPPFEGFGLFPIAAMMNVSCVHPTHEVRVDLRTRFFAAFL